MCSRLENFKVYATKKTSTITDAMLYFRYCQNKTWKYEITSVIFVYTFMKLHQKVIHVFLL